MGACFAAAARLRLKKLQNFQSDGPGEPLVEYEPRGAIDLLNMKRARGALECGLFACYRFGLELCACSILGPQVYDLTHTLTKLSIG